MIITSSTSGYTEKIVLDGRLDVNGAIEFEHHLQQVDPFIKEVILDFAKLSYVSSMGLRVILQTYKSFVKLQKKLSIVNIPDNIKATFEMTGFIQAFLKEEKLVLIEKGQSDVSITYSLAGILNAETSAMLDSVAHDFKIKNIRRVVFLCDELEVAGNEAFLALGRLHNFVLSHKGTLSLRNVSQQVVDEASRLGHRKFLESCSSISRNGNIMPSKGTETEEFVCTGTWGSFTLPKLDHEWRCQHQQVGRVVVNLKTATGITPEAFAAIMQLKACGADIGLAVEILM